MVGHLLSALRSRLAASDHRAFPARGFLSPHSRWWRRQTRREHETWFALADQVSDVCMRLLPSIRPAAGNNRQLLAALLFRRAVQSYQATVLLCERGMAADARTLARSCVESAIILAALATTEGFEDRIGEAYDRHRRAVANSLLADPAAQPEIDDQARLKLKQLLAEIALRYPKGPRDINLQETADKAGFLMIYNTVYRGISGDAAHPTLESLMRHFDDGTATAEESTVFAPDSRGIDDTLSAAAAAVLHAMEPVSRIYGHIGIDDDVRALLAAWKRLVIPEEAP